MFKVLNSIKGRHLLCIINNNKVLVSSSTSAVNLIKYNENIKTVILLSENKMNKYSNSELYKYIKKSKYIQI